MGGGHHEYARIPEVSEGQSERNMPSLFVHRDRTHLRARHDSESSSEDGSYHDRSTLSLSTGARLPRALHQFWTESRHGSSFCLRP
jgi:hypothetical protein